MLWGRSGPVNSQDKAFMYADGTKEVDLNFLYSANTIAEVFHSRADLKRQPAAMFRGPGNLFDDAALAEDIS